MARVPLDWVCGVRLIYEEEPTNIANLAIIASLNETRLSMRIRNPATYYLLFANYLQPITYHQLLLTDQPHGPWAHDISQPLFFAAYFSRSVRPAYFSRPRFLAYPSRKYYYNKVNRLGEGHKIKTATFEGTA